MTLPSDADGATNRVARDVETPVTKLAALEKSQATRATLLFERDLLLKAVY